MGESQSGVSELGERELRAIVASRAVTVDIAGTLVPATLSERPFYDPGGGRLRGTSPPSPPETLVDGG
jgi:hypothetical protein